MSHYQNRSQSQNNPNTSQNIYRFQPQTDQQQQPLHDISVTGLFGYKMQPNQQQNVSQQQQQNTSFVNRTMGNINSQFHGGRNIGDTLRKEQQYKDFYNQRSATGRSFADDRSEHVSLSRHQHHDQQSQVYGNKTIIVFGLNQPINKNLNLLNQSGFTDRERSFNNRSSSFDNITRNTQQNQQYLQLRHQVIQDFLGIPVSGIENLIQDRQTQRQNNVKFADLRIGNIFDNENDHDRNEQLAKPYKSQYADIADHQYKGRAGLVQNDENLPYFEVKYSKHEDAELALKLNMKEYQYKSSSSNNQLRFVINVRYKDQSTEHGMNILEEQIGSLGVNQQRKQGVQTSHQNKDRLQILEELLQQEKMEKGGNYFNIVGDGDGILGLFLYIINLIMSQFMIFD
eukprot:403346868